MAIVEIEVTAPLPDEGVIGRTYRMEGVAKLGDRVGAFPWVYARVQKKDWYKPDIVEETDYKRGFPIPISGKFTIDWTPEKTGIYDVTIVATPAPLSLPVIGVPPVTGQTDIMKMTIAEKPDSGLEILQCSFA